MTDQPGVIPHRHRDPSHGLEDLDRGLVVGAAAPRPSLADDPSLPALLGDLDRGLAGGGDSDVHIERPPLIARLLIPSARKRQRLFQRDPANVLESDGVRGSVNRWMTAGAIILAIFLGATAAALVFQDRLAQIVDPWQTGRK